MSVNDCRASLLGVAVEAKFGAEFEESLSQAQNDLQHIFAGGPVVVRQVLPRLAPKLHNVSMLLQMGLAGRQLGHSFLAVALSDGKLNQHAREEGIHCHRDPRSPSFKGHVPPAPARLMRPVAPLQGGAA